MRTLFVFTLVFLVLTSCHKKPENNYSYWHVNNDSFATNETYVSEGDFKPRSDFATSSHNNGFWLIFSSGTLPIDGKFEITTDYVQNPNTTNICIYHENAKYLISANSSAYLQASEVNGKAHYSLPQAWYINLTNPADSILVYGELTTP